MNENKHPLGLSQRVLNMARQAEADIRGQFAHIDAVAEYNSQKVLAAFQSHRVAEAHFAGTTGYGYDDLGRDTLDQIYARDLRHRGRLGAHRASSTAPTPSPPPCTEPLKPGDTLLSAVGAPYDTLLSVIGVTGRGAGAP